MRAETAYGGSKLRPEINGTIQFRSIVVQVPPGAHKVHPAEFCAIRGIKVQLILWFEELNCLEGRNVISIPS